MSYFGAAFSRNLRSLRTCLNNSFVLNSRNYCEPGITRPPAEKSVNRVTLLGRVGIDPQLRGTETRRVVIFTLATNVNYRHESGEFQQKTEWHRISVFREHLRDIVLGYLRKGSRVYLEGRLTYGEITDPNGVVHNTTSIIANDIIFVGPSRKKDIEIEDEEEE